jgi:hypothetical protein
MRRKRPRPHAFEQLILQHEMLGIGPVIRYFGIGMKAHHVVPRDAVMHHAAIRALALPASLGRLSRNESVHFIGGDAVIKIGLRVR